MYKYVYVYEISRQNPTSFHTQYIISIVYIFMYKYVLYICVCMYVLCVAERNIYFYLFIYLLSTVYVKYGHNALPVHQP